jgi:apolipoprotein N-acyltransferase
MFSELIAVLINNFLLFAIALAAAAGLAWLLVEGIRTGELRSVAWANRGTFRRDRNPLIFWLVAGTYAVSSVVIAATPCVVVWENLPRN